MAASLHCEIALAPMPSVRIPRPKSVVADKQDETVPADAAAWGKEKKTIPTISWSSSTVIFYVMANFSKTVSRFLYTGEEQVDLWEFLGLPVWRPVREIYLTTEVHDYDLVSRRSGTLVDPDPPSLLGFTLSPVRDLGGTCSRLVSLTIQNSLLVLLLSWSWSSLSVGLAATTNNAPNLVSAAWCSEFPKAR